MILILYYKVKHEYFKPWLQNMDVGEFSPFLDMGFSSPPVDHDTPPTFGTMLSCVTVAIRILSKVGDGFDSWISKHSIIHGL